MPNLSERRAVAVVGAVQFINILDFMMVVPLGPDFARDLGIPSSQLGIIGGSYTAAAAVSGFIGSFVLDRFDRRRALALTMAGLVLGTAAGGLANNLGGLLLARVIAGLFGGPATSIAYSIVADVVPPERRGKAMGAVMGALSVAQVVGVPVALELARHGGWRLPFFVVAGAGLAIVAASIWALPSLRLHLDGAAGGHGGGEHGHRGHGLGELRRDLVDGLRDLGALLGRRTVQCSYAMTATVMMAGFLLLPNLPAYLQENLHYPREHFHYLYAVGGVVGFATLRVVGRFVDRFGSFRVGTVGALGHIALMYAFFIVPNSPIPVMLMFVLLTLALSTRNVAYNALTTLVPRPQERARFLSLQSTVYHAASSVGAILSSRLLRTLPDRSLAGMPLLATWSSLLTALLPPLLWIVEARVRRERAQ